MAVAELAPVQAGSEEIKAGLAASIAASRILIRPIELIAYASDASFYRLIPKAVIQADSVDEIRVCLAGWPKLNF
jgi:D-lactate dehydrogenase